MKIEFTTKWGEGVLLSLHVNKSESENRSRASEI